jgi:N-methylhydantoinase A
MRYVGQIHEVEVELPEPALNGGGLAPLVDAFHSRHEALYTYSEPDSPCEVINVHLGVSVPRTALPTPPYETDTELPDEARKGSRRAWFDGEFVETQVFDGALLRPGNELDGPAIIEEVTTTIVVAPDWHASLDGRGFYVLRRAGR